MMSFRLVTDVVWFFVVGILVRTRAEQKKRAMSGSWLGMRARSKMRQEIACCNEKGRKLVGYLAYALTFACRLHSGNKSFAFDIIW